MKLFNREELDRIVKWNDWVVCLFLFIYLFFCLWKPYLPMFRFYPWLHIQELLFKYLFYCLYLSVPINFVNAFYILYLVLCPMCEKWIVFAVIFKFPILVITLLLIWCKSYLIWCIPIDFKFYWTLSLNLNTVVTCFS